MEAAVRFLDEEWRVGRRGEYEIRMVNAKLASIGCADDEGAERDRPEQLANVRFHTGLIITAARFRRNPPRKEYGAAGDLPTTPLFPPEQ